MGACELNDRIDLPSLSSFYVDDSIAVIASFRFTQAFIMNGAILGSSLSIDFPSLKSIHLGDGSFCFVHRAEITSEGD